MLDRFVSLPRLLLLALAPLLLLAACQEETAQQSTALSDTVGSSTDTAATLPDTAGGLAGRGGMSGMAAGTTRTGGARAGTASPGAGIDTSGPGPAAIPQGQYTTTASGLKYYTLQQGSGASPSATDRVRVHYTGWLQSNGRKFDSSRDRGQPATFRLNRVIEGWTEGLQLMQVGGTRQFVIPPELGYGQRGAGSAIPPGATLVFQVELLGVEGQSGGGSR